VVVKACKLYIGSNPVLTTKNKIMEVGTLIEVIRWGFSIFVVVWCFSMLYTGIKDMNDIDDIMKKK
jgi:hypothetical protein